MKYIAAKEIVSKTKNSAWFGMQYNMNIYRGCCHNCIYCDSRSECYRIDDFHQVRAKENALRIIRDDLRRKTMKGVIGTGSMSDPYNPFERELLLTRHSLELINAFEFGVAIATKSALITRDIDLLGEIKTHSPVLVKITVTCADDRLSQLLEPHAATSSERFAAVKELSDSGIYCGILMMPILPYINDSEKNILGILHQAKNAGARFVYPAFGVTLRDRQRDYFYAQLDQHFPGVKEKYARRFGNSYSCASPDANQLFEVFKRECNTLGLLYDMKEIVRSYRLGYEQEQLTLF